VRAADGITADMPLEQAIARIEADPIALEIMWSRLITVVEEMWLTICRTAFSLVISESQDFATELLDPTGETLAHSPRAMPVFNLTLPLAVKALLERYPAETLVPGDVLITNDPWLCAGHLFDIAVVTPVFLDGKVVGLMGTVGHVSDIGGTKDSLRAREIYEEGFQIPPMKLFEAGRPNESLFRLLAENVRNPEQVLGDIHSFVAANALGGERLVSFLGDYGMKDLRALAAVVQGRSEKAMRDAIRALPDGEYHSTIWNNPLGQRLDYPLKLTVSGDEIELDFEGAPPQLPQGGLNSTLNYTSGPCHLPAEMHADAGRARQCRLLPPLQRQGAGGLHPEPEASASVNLRTRTGWYLAPNIFRALSDAAPRQVQANTGLPMAAYMYGQDAEGRTYSDMLFIGGGQGASAHGDGKNGLLWPTSAANTSIELFEARVPVLVLEKTFVTDTGGAGKHRGGLGQRVKVRKLHDDGLTTLITVYPEGVGNPIAGLFGGKAGGEASGRVLDTEGNEVLNCGTGMLVQIDRDTQVVEIVLAGGSGFGEPAERDPAVLARDVQRGLVSEEGAARDYAVAPVAATA
jgi:5-oxoprolinase (ATP-hydrolysing)